MPVPPPTAPAATGTSPGHHLQVRPVAVPVVVGGSRRRGVDDQTATVGAAAVADDPETDDAVVGVERVLDVGGRQQEALPGRPATARARPGQLERGQRHRRVGTRRRRRSTTAAVGDLDWLGLRRRRVDDYTETTSGAGIPP